MTMSNNKSFLIELISLAAIAGNILFVLWILYNGINEGFRGTTAEKFSYITLMGLMTVNSILLIRNRMQQNKNN